MAAHWWWWSLGVLLLVAEVLSGTFYLLMLAIGAAVGGLVAIAGGALALQVLAAAAAATLAWLILRRVSPRMHRRPPAGEDPAVLLDIGQRVRIERWSEPRRTTVLYRGAEWLAELDETEAEASAPADYVIRRVAGSRLIVARTG